MLKASKHIHSVNSICSNTQSKAVVPEPPSPSTPPHTLWLIWAIDRAQPLPQKAEVTSARVLSRGRTPEPDTPPPPQNLEQAGGGGERWLERKNEERGRAERMKMKKRENQTPTYRINDKHASMWTTNGPSSAGSQMMTSPGRLTTHNAL